MGAVQDLLTPGDLGQAVVETKAKQNPQQAAHGPQASIGPKQARLVCHYTSEGDEEMAHGLRNPTAHIAKTAESNSPAISTFKPSRLAFSTWRTPIAWYSNRGTFDQSSLLA